MSDLRSELAEPHCYAYSVDDRGNVVDCYGQYADGGWERVGRLDREAGPPPCNQLAWSNWYDDPGLDAYMSENGYSEELTEAKHNNKANHE